MVNGVVLESPYSQSSLTAAGDLQEPYLYSARLILG